MTKPRDPNQVNPVTPMERLYSDWSDPTPELENSQMFDAYIETLSHWYAWHECESLYTDLVLAYFRLADDCDEYAIDFILNTAMKEGK